MTVGLPELEGHPHAQAVLGGAISGEREASHAYLLTGPGLTLKRASTLSFVTELMCGSGDDRDVLAARIERGTHPDVTWIAPSGAHEMLRADIDEPVVTASTHTPFEAAKRVFVIERADTMNDEAANRLLKTLEEPPEYVHLVLLATRLEDVLPTIRSRCQVVRFESLAPEAISSVLERGGVDGETARVTARLSQGDLDLAERLASEFGVMLRAAAARLALATLRGGVAEERPWIELLALAKTAGDAAASSVEDGLEERLEFTSKKDKKKVETEAADRGKRAKRRSETDALDLALWLVNSIFRDLLVTSCGASTECWNADLGEQLSSIAASAERADLELAVELVERTRESLKLNVTAELALEALAYRLEALFGSSGST